MSEIALPLEARIVHEIPEALANAIGRLIAAYSKAEHKLTSISAWVLQLNRTEARIALREPRGVDRLEMALDLCAIKEIPVTVDTDTLRENLQRATTERDRVAHGVWLEHPTTKKLFLRVTRGDWPKNLTRGNKIKRGVYPQAIPYQASDCLNALALVEKTIEQIEALGADVDRERAKSPQKFALLAPSPNPLGRRTRKGK